MENSLANYPCDDDGFALVRETSVNGIVLFCQRAVAVGRRPFDKTYLTTADFISVMSECYDVKVTPQQAKAALESVGAHHYGKVWIKKKLETLWGLAGCETQTNKAAMYYEAQGGASSTRGAMADALWHGIKNGDEEMQWDVVTVLDVSDWLRRKGHGSVSSIMASKLLSTVGGCKLGQINVRPGVRSMAFAVRNHDEYIKRTLSWAQEYYSREREKMYGAPSEAVWDENDGEECE